MKISSLLLALAVAACGNAGPPPVSVGPVSYGEKQLLGLSVEQRHTLADLTAFALAVSDSTTDALGAPLRRRARDDRRLDILAANLLLADNGVGNDVLKARYMTNPDYELTVRHILFLCERWRSPAEKAAARAKAERALALVKGGADFARTAARLSEEPGAEGREGLLKPGRKGDWVDPFWNAASALEVGEISPVVETQYGFHVIKLENRTVVPFAEARSRIAREVARQIGDPDDALKAWMDSAGTKVEVSSDGLSAAAAPTADTSTTLARWPGGSLTLGEYLAWAASQPASWAGGGRGSDPSRFRASVEALARRRVALAEADRQGVTVPAAEIKEIDRAWGDSTYQWAASLDFGYHLAPDQIAREALAAFGNAGQQAGLVRADLDERAPLLAARYDLVVGGETPGSEQP
jgi:PPIC-type PPIASE domain